MQRPRDLVVLLKPGTAAEDLGQPKLPNSSLHMSNLALRGQRGLDPLGRFPTDAAYHVCMR